MSMTKLLEAEKIDNLEAPFAIEITDKKITLHVNKIYNVLSFFYRQWSFVYKHN
jgi:hypothetical protein